MGAGLGGSTAKNLNVNGNTGGGNKKQGLATTTNTGVSFASNAIKNKAYGENRDFIFCVNQLGGIGGKSKMFATTADGVKDCVEGPVCPVKEVTHAYLTVFGRHPDASGIKTYCDNFRKKNWTLEMIITDLINSDEGQAILAQLIPNFNSVSTFNWSSNNNQNLFATSVRQHIVQQLTSSSHGPQALSQTVIDGALNITSTITPDADPVTSANQTVTVSFNLLHSIFGMISSGDFTVSVDILDTIAPVINTIGFNFGQLNIQEVADQIITINTTGVENSLDLTLGVVSVGGSIYYHQVQVANNVVAIPTSNIFPTPDGDGQYRLTAQVSDEAGNQSALVTSDTFTVDMTSPSINTIGFNLGPYLNLDEDNSDGTVTVDTSGVEDGQPVTITINGINPNVYEIYSYTANVNNNSATVTISAADLQALSDGNYSVTADVSDAAGNPAVQVTSASFTKDTTVPAVVGMASNLMVWNISNENTQDGLTVTVNTYGGATKVTVRFIDESNGDILFFYDKLTNGSADVDVNIPYTDYLVNLQNGETYTINAIAEDAAGNVSSSASISGFIVDLTAPSISFDSFSWSGSFLNSSEASNIQTVTVTTSGVEDNQIVSVALNGNSYTGAVTNNSATVTILAADLQALTDGSHIMTADVSDAAGNPATQATSNSFTVDQTSPSISPIATTALSWGATLNSAEDNNDGTVTVSTSGANGQNVTITLNGNSYTGAVTNNSATVTILAADLQALTDGQSYAMTADVSDAAGNPAVQVTSASFNVDKTSPVINTIESSWGAFLNIGEAAVDGTVTVTTSGVEDNQVVTITLNGTDYTANVTNNSATATIPTTVLANLSNAQFNITANVSDAAGNLAQTVTSSNFTVDLTVPTISAIGRSWGTVMNIGEQSDLNGQVVTVDTGGVADGRVVSISGFGNNLYTGIVSGNSAQVNIPVAAFQALIHAQTYFVTASVSDVAGNPAVPYSVSFTVDVVAPSISAIQTSWGDYLNSADAAGNGTVTVTTSAADGQNVTVTLNGQTYTSAVTNNSATVTIDAAALSALADDTHAMTADVEDVNGNPAAQVSTSFAKDTTAPSISQILTSAFSWGDTLNSVNDNSNGTVTVSTTGVEDGQEVSVELNNNTYISAVSGGSATTVTIPATHLQALTDGGTYTMTANVSDAAGNPATTVTSAPFTVNRTPSINSMTTSWGGVLNSNERNNDGTVTVSTTSVEDGQTVTIASSSTYFQYTGAVSGGIATVTISAVGLQALNNGNHSMTADVSNVAGDSASATMMFNVDTVLPIISSITPAWGSILNSVEQSNTNGGVVVVVTDAEDGQIVTITLNNATYTGAVTTNNGVTSATVNIPTTGLQALTDGSTYTMTANVDDVAGNPAVPFTSASFDVDTALPIISAIATSDFSWGPYLNIAEAQNNGTVNVTTTDVEDGLNVTITLNNNSYTGAVNTNSATVTIPAADLQALTDGGTYTMTADAADTNGNPAVQVTSASFDVDFTIPTISSISIPWGSVLNSVEDNTDQDVIVVTTGVEDGQQVSVVLNNITYIYDVYSNSATVTILAANLQALTDGGTYTMTANVSDIAGNAAVAVTSASFDVDRALPTINSISIPWGATLNSVEDNTDQVVTVSTTDVEDGLNVTITLNNNSYTGAVSGGSATVTISAAGLQALTDGQSYTMTADVSDVVGNPAAPATSASFDVDTALPIISSITPAWGAFLNIAEAAIDGTVNVTTTDVEDNQTVVVVLNGTAYNGNVTSNSATVTIPAADLQALTDGQSYTMTADVSDAAGNPAVQVSTSFDVDFTIPTISSITPAWGSVLNSVEDNTDQDVTVVTSGAEDGQQVSVALNNITYTGDVTSNSATVTILAADLQALTDGQSYTMTADVFDIAGNAAVAVTSAAFDVDRALPTINSITSPWGNILNILEDDNDQDVTVTTSGAENNQIVTITLNGATYTGTVTNNSAAVTILASALQALTDGATYTMTADVSDVNSNPAQTVTSAAFTVDRTTMTNGTLDTIFVNDNLSLAEATSGQVTYNAGTILLPYVNVSVGQTIRFTIEDNASPGVAVLTHDETYLPGNNGLVPVVFTQAELQSVVNSVGANTAVPHTIISNVLDYDGDVSAAPATTRAFTVN